MPDGRMQSPDCEIAGAEFNYDHRGVCPSFTAHKIKKWDLLNFASPIFIAQAFLHATALNVLQISSISGSRIVFPDCSPEYGYVL